MSTASAREIIVKEWDAIIITFEYIVSDYSILTALLKKYPLVVVIMYITVKDGY